MKKLPPLALLLLLALPAAARAYTCDPFTNACRDLCCLDRVPGYLKVPVNRNLTIGSIAFGTLLYANDRQVLKIIQSNKSSTVKNMQQAVGDIGNGGYELAALGAFVGTSYLIDNPQLRETSYMAAESFLAANAIGMFFKYSVGRARPYHGSKHKFSPFAFRNEHASFPSGHTTSAFSIASVFSANYEARWVGILAYGAAGAVVLQRVYTNNHWPSDVFAGAVLGTVTGRAVVRFSADRQAARAKAAGETSLLLPMWQPGLAGVMLATRF